MKTVHYIAILIVFSAVLFTLGLGNMALTDPDETFYAQTAKEMMESRQWVTPIIFGEPQFEKPPLFYWMIRVSYHVFGIGEFAARFPAALMGLLGVIGIFFLGRLLYSARCGFFSGLIAATSLEYVVLARGCVTDMALTVFILLTFLFFLRGLESSRRSEYFIAAVCAALAVLTKGPIGLFLTGSVMLLYLFFSKQIKRIYKIPVFWSLVIFAIVSFPWYILAYKAHGEVFINEFFGFQNVTRFLVPEHRIGDSPVFYIPVIIGGFFPWTVFMPAAVWRMWKRRIPSKVTAAGVFLATWFLVVFIFFSTSRTKLVTYIFPLFPALAIICGAYWDNFLSSKGEGNVAKWMKGAFIFLALAVLGTVFGAIIFIQIEYGIFLTNMLVPGFIAVILSIISVVYIYRGKGQRAFITVVLVVALTILSAVQFVLPAIGELESSRQLSHRFVELAREDEPIGGECDHARGVAFYTGRKHIENVHPYHDLKTFVLGEGRVWCIIQKKHYAQLQVELPDNVSSPIAEYGGYVLITNKPGDKNKYLQK